MNTMAGSRFDSVMPFSYRQICQFVGDPWTLLLAGTLLCLGFVMLTSASIAIATMRFDFPLHYGVRQLIYLALGTLASFCVLMLPLKFWYQNSHFLLLTSLFLLVIVLIPGIGTVVNGSRRWVNVGVAMIQVAEVVKLFFVIYMASYLARFGQQVRLEFQGFVKPMVVLASISILLLLQPDFGTTVVICSTCILMLYLAGVRLHIFIGLLGLAFASLALVAVSESYRVKRLVSFLDPWRDQFDSGYQLTQSLIAFGQGGWFGLGLGKSVQKLFYLPEAHTDFVFAVFAEELGLLGVFCLIALFVALYGRMFFIASKALAQKQIFASFMVYGITSWFCLQTIVSMGVNTGLLPTKGLTLPFISYGGSSLIISMVAIALTLRVAKHLNDNPSLVKDLP